jgi:hypothetical protein
LNPRRANRRGLLAPVASALLLAFFPYNPAVHGETHQLGYRQITCHQYGLADAATPKQVRDALSRPPVTEAAGQQGERWKTNPQGLVEISRSGKATVWTPQKGLPILPLTSIAVGTDGWVWMGTPDGAICFRPEARGGERWFYFRGRRYLADNSVLNVVAGSHGAWIQTRTGTSLIDSKQFSLDEKSALFIKRLHRCNDRYGLVADALLTRPGDLSSCKPVSNDNDGLWTSLYISSECFRYATTHSPDALRNAQNSLKGMYRLLWITGIPGFPARSYIRRAEGGDRDGMWHWAPDRAWKWKGDTSSDELVGHFFVYGIAYDLLPQEDEFDREAIRNAAVNIANNLREHGWNLAGYDGRITRWGRFSPAYFKTPTGQEDAPLNSLELLSILRVAYHVSGNESFIRDYHRLIKQDGYLRRLTEGFAKLPPLTQFNFSDEELAFLSFYPVMKYEDDPDLRRQYQSALADLWRHAEGEHNPLWDYIYKVGTGAENYDAQGALNTLERIPLDMITWSVRNSQRLDLSLTPLPNEDGQRQSLKVILPDERCTSKWNGNPYALDCTSGGKRVDDGTYFLLPYWLGRYYKLVGP